MQDILLNYQKFNQNLSNYLLEINQINLNFFIIFLTVIIFFVSYTSQYKIIQQINVLLSFFPTLVHEVGHAFIGRLTGSKIKNIKMSLTVKTRDKTGTQGFALMNFRNRISQILSGFFGYIFPPLFLILAIWGAENNKLSLYFLAIILSIFIWFVYSSQKWIPLVIFTIFIFLGVDIKFNNISNYILYLMLNIITGLLLGETLRSIYVTFKVNFSKIDWDGTALRKITFIPSTVWLIIWTIISLFACLKLILYFF